MRTRPRPDAPQLAVLVLVALAATVLALGVGYLRASDEEAVLQPDELPASAWAGLVGAPKVHAAVGQRVLVQLRVPSLARRIQRAGGQASEAQQRRWTAAVLAAERQVIADIAGRGVRVEPEFLYARVMAGFSAALDARSISVVERMPAVAGVYPVRATYPTAAGVPAGGGRPTGVALPGYSGRGVTVALLDTGVDHTHPALRGSVRGGYDVLAGDNQPDAEPQPGDPRDMERHGTQLAGLIAGTSTGVAPGAHLLPIRVAGWQRDTEGSWTVYGRTDQLIAGLERAVDPNGDGDTHDAARIAAVGVAAPYAAFADGPEAEAIAGAETLDTLVVSPAGNDGPAGPRYGSIAGPGGTAATLTVGAAEPRWTGRVATVAVQAGLEVAFDGTVAMAGDTPSGRLKLPLALPRPLPAAGAPPRDNVLLEDFFDSRGHSLVAGRAALVRAGTAPERAATAALSAGAAAVVLYGGRLPAGALELESTAGVPVVGIPEPAGLAVASQLREGTRGTVAIAGRGHAAVGGGVAPFSSRGLAFDGRLKPDLVAAGVGLRTPEPGETESGEALFGSISGASAATAVAAGAAALLAQARPDLEAAELRGALVGAARPLAADSRAAQGAGLLDVGASAATELVAEPTTLAFRANAAPRWVERRSFVLRNVSSRVLRARLRARVDAGAPAVTMRLRPARLTLRPGRTQRVSLTVRAREVGAPVTGWVEVEAAGGHALSVPWGGAPSVLERNLLSDVALSTSSFRPSDTAPSVLTFTAGRLVRAREGFQVQAVSRLDLELRRAGIPRPLGLLTRLRHLLPGQYAFGLTGRGPGGKALPPGRYVVRLRAYPTGSGPPTRRALRFTVIAR